MRFRRLRSRHAGFDSKSERARRTRRRTLEIPEVLEDRLAPATLLVNSVADNITDTSHLTLRDAIMLVDSGGKVAPLGQSSIPGGWASQISGTFGTNDTIDFSSALGGDTIELDGGALAISANLTITGLGASNLAISGNHSSLIFQVDHGATGHAERADPGSGAGNVVSTGTNATVNGATSLRSPTARAERSAIPAT